MCIDFQAGGGPWKFRSQVHGRWRQFFFGSVFLTRKKLGPSLLLIFSEVGSEKRSAPKRMGEAGSILLIRFFCELRKVLFGRFFLEEKA
jgi:hypothetical protein